MAAAKKLKDPIQAEIDTIARQNILDQILASWAEFPNLRLGQLIENARLTEGMGEANKDLFYIEDLDLVGMMQRFATRQKEEASLKIITPKKKRLKKTSM